MFEILKIYWKAYRLEIAIIVAIIIVGISLILPLYDTEPYNFLAALIHSIMTIGLCLVMTPAFMIVYYFYKRQEIKRNPGYKIEPPDIFTLDNFLSVFTVYSIVGFILGQIAENVMIIQ